MARGKIEIVHRAWTLERGDARAMGDLAYADYEFQRPSALPNAGVYRRESKLARTQVFSDHAGAMETAGLAARPREY